MRVGVFSGTFDPVHMAHLILAEQCREQAKLDQVLFMPALLPPHKQRYAITPFAQRVEMLALAISGQPAFQIDEREKDRTGPSYTVDTLADLTLTRPGDEFFFVLGSDSIREMPTWRQPRRIVECASLLVVARPDFPPPAEAELRTSFGFAADTSLRYQIIDAPLIAISSREIRQRISEG